jgi:indolepyruvate ferredoxin oxidoreductase
LVIDAGRIAENLFGDHFAANVILLGAAYQHGCLPLSAESVERAIELNGASVSTNIQAFRWGRASVAVPDVVRGALTSEPTPPLVPAAAVALVQNWGLADPIAAAVAQRYEELSTYQNRAYADEYLRCVEEVHRLERVVDSVGDRVLTSAFASGLFKLMAYKDEYEVARLHLAELDKLRAEFGRAVRVKVLLHPPTLKTFGLHHKIALGRSAFVVFRVLRFSRRLRGTGLDLFGYTAMRRLERKLVGDYRDTVLAAAASLTADNLRSAVLLAELPDIIRGYDEVKLKNVERFRARRDEILVERAARVAAES